MSFKDELTKLNTLYYNSLSTGELWEAVKELDKLLFGGLLNEENRENAEALYLRTVVKLRLLEYVRSFDVQVYAELCDYIGTESGKAEKRGYNKTLKVFNSAKVLIDNIKNIISQANDIKRGLSDGTSAEVVQSAVTALDTLVALAESTNFTSPFGDGVASPDIALRVFDYLANIKNRALEIKKQELGKRARENFKEISKLYTLAEYYPLPEYSEGATSNAVIVCTPFADEALLYCAHACRKDKALYTLDALRLENFSESEICELFEIAVNLDYDIIVLSLSVLANNKKNKLFESAMRAGSEGIRVFLHDSSGDNSSYETCMKIAIESNLGTSGIGSAYVSMPSFGDVCAEFESKRIIAGPVDYDKLREMPFMGFSGLNKVVTSYISGSDWIKTGRKISKANEAAARNYLAKLKSSYLFIDSGWGNFSSTDKIITETDGEFDYDGVKSIDLENVRRIIESPNTVFAKCGMIVRYCTLGGGDKTDWVKLEREEMSERVALATRLVFRLLKVDIVPEVEVADALENGSAGGLCCFGGKKIIYKYEACLNINWLLDAIVHESFHAMQYKLCDGGWSEWYLINLHVTRGRVERWKFTKTIYDGNTGSAVYKVHIFENDAYAFEKDCDDGRNFAWNSIDLI